MPRPFPPHVGQTSELVHKISLRNPANKKLSKKGTAYLQQMDNPTKPLEMLRVVARRVSKAERDERMDITQALTPVKQYMAGFTRPGDLRSSNWFPGGAYLTRNKKYEEPPEEAYRPHTVYILESRYDVRYGHGRPEAPEYIYGACREEDFSSALKNYNSKNAPRETLDTMDNARWPSGPQSSRLRRTAWWTSATELNTVLMELGREPASNSNAVEGDTRHTSPFQQATSSKSPASLHTSHATPVTYSKKKRAIVSRGEYLATLDDRPFWRPLFTATFATRPLALSYLRLIKGRATGTPFYVDIPERQSALSFGTCMRQTRLHRAMDLVVTMTELLGGARGGFVGIRCDPSGYGRGIGGEGLDRPLPQRIRSIQVGIGRWTPLALELKALLRHRLETSAVGEDTTEIFILDEHGERRRKDGGDIVPWRPRELTSTDTLVQQQWYMDFRTLKTAASSFLRYSQAFTGSPTSQTWGFVGEDSLAEPKPVPETATEKEEDDQNHDESEDDEGYRSEEDELSSDSSPPVVFVRSPHPSVSPGSVISSLSQTLRDNPPSDIDVDLLPPFVLCSPAGEPIYGPRDDRGQIVMDQMDFKLPWHVARALVQHRLDSICSSKMQELASVAAVSHSSVFYPVLGYEEGRLADALYN
ncbi:unnamed protein product [Mycena citricolor]|uniref:Uncharacterized protein n=1 Tax=Mycena citricolor TaxID=2018698 RepID=A0AAD2GTI4_9AGAR|nr:unnamed protein product [Mycena citricolor]